MPAAIIDKRYMNVAIQWLLLVGPKPITATGGVNPFSMLQLRSATFRFPLPPITHAATRLAPREGDRLAWGNRDEHFSSRGGNGGNREGDNPILAIPHDTAGFRRHAEHLFRCGTQSGRRHLQIAGPDS